MESNVSASARFNVPRRILTWQYAATPVNGESDLEVSLGSTPPLNTIAIPSGPGQQAMIVLGMQWASGVRPSDGITKMVLKPRYRIFWGSDSPNSDGTADRGNKQPVLMAASNDRVMVSASDPGLLSLDDTGNVGSMSGVRPMNYRPRPVPVGAGTMRTVATELVDDQFEVFRDADGSTQRHLWWHQMMGLEPMTFGTGAASGQAQAAALNELSFYLEIAWYNDLGVEMTAADIDAAVDSPFLAGDSITVLCRQGYNAPGN
jgi:hypothetical protein